MSAFPTEPPPQSSPRLMAAAAALPVVAVALKLTLLAIYGPVMPPDTMDYVRVSDQIISGKIWTVGLHDELAAMSIFRVIGFPALITFLRTIAGDSWPWLLIALQNLGSLWVSFEIFRLLRQTKISVLWASAGASMYLMSLALVLDQVTLTDSLCATLIALPAIWLGRSILSGRPLMTWRLLVIGLSITLAFLLREATLYIIGPAFLFLVLASAMPGAARGQFREFGHGLLALLLVFSPLLLTQLAYRAWNQDRIGRPIITSGMQSTMFQAMAIAAKHRPDVFSGSTPVDQAARTHFRSYEDFSEVWKINQHLRESFGMSQVDIANAAAATYFRLWREHPGAMLRIPIYHLRANIVVALLQPFASIRLLHIWATEERSSFAEWRSVRSGNYSMLPLFVVDNLMRVISALIFISFVLLTPLRLFFTGPSRASLMALGFWLCYFAFLSAYALIHLEVRYLFPVTGIATITGIINMFWLMETARVWRQKRASGDRI